MFRSRRAKRWAIVSLAGLMLTFGYASAQQAERGQTSYMPVDITESFAALMARLSAAKAGVVLRIIAAEKLPPISFRNNRRGNSGELKIVITCLFSPTPVTPHAASPTWVHRFERHKVGADSAPRNADGSLPPDKTPGAERPS